MEPQIASLPAVLRFGRFEVRPANRELLLDGQPVTLGARAFDVLLALIERRGQLVTKQELLDLAWPGLVVEENNLAVQISTLRKIFGAGAIATVAGRGYQFTLDPTFQAVARAEGAGLPAHNLPVRVTSFIGRQAEVSEVRRSIAVGRLLTLVGAGGVGKTRLALEVAAQAIDDHADGVWLAELAPLADASLVAQTVATLLGVREQRGETLTASLVKALHGKSLLLVLDNCEHVVEAAAWLCDALLAGCENVCILATSREPLRVSGEATYRVPSLAVPAPDAAVDAHGLARYPAVQLFAERALAVEPSFGIDAHNAEAVAAICRRLDGIALAIELAAARVRAISVHEMLDRLDQRFQLLNQGARTALPRQQTLRAAIDWSYDLLDSEERALLRRLSVFAGGATLAAVEQVCVGAEITAAVLDLLAALVDKSLVVVQDRTPLTRYGLLESVQHYARDRLREQSDAAVWRLRHLAYFRSLAEEARPHLRGKDQQAWLDRVQLEHDNLRLALACAMSPGADPAAGLRIAASIWWFWYVRGFFTEGRNWLVTAVAATRDATADEVRANALYGAAALAWGQSDYDAARDLVEQSLAACRSIGNLKGAADALNLLAVVAKEQNQYDRARALHEESIAIHRKLDNRAGIAVALCNLATIADDIGQYDLARAQYTESLELFRQLGDDMHVALLLQNLANLEDKGGDYVAAEDLQTQSLALRRKLGDRRGVAMALENLGVTAASVGDMTRARTLLEESLEIRRALGDRRGIAVSLTQLACVLFDLGEDARARALHRESLSISWPLGARLYVAAALDGLATALPDRYRAAQLWGGAERLRQEIDTPLPPAERVRYDRIIAQARATAEDGAAFDAAWQQGKSMPIEALVEYALAFDAEGRV